LPYLCLDGIDVSEETDFNNGMESIKVGSMPPCVAVGDKTISNYLHGTTRVPVDFPAAPPLQR